MKLHNKIEYNRVAEISWPSIQENNKKMVLDQEKRMHHRI